jgi:xylulose-5-phosphate/fructose-6-phosphate phosphoketolase
VHLNRLIKAHELDMLLVVGPGHGGPGIVANTYLEGTYTEHYPAIERDRSGMRRLFRQFSWPGGIPSHVAPKPRARSTKAASSAIRWRMPTAPPSTTRA